jgi:hypothetical protein
LLAIFTGSRSLAIAFYTLVWKKRPYPIKAIAKAQEENSTES